MTKQVHAERMWHAYSQAKHSPDPSTQNGAVIFDEMDGFCVAGGHNGFPCPEMSSEARLQRPAKYEWMEHAERAAIFDLVSNRQKADTKTMYCLWAACSDCARAIIMSGVSTLVTHSFYGKALEEGDNNGDRENWGPRIDTAMQMFKEAGVEVIYIDDRIMSDDDPEILFNGKLVRF